MEFSILIGGEAGDGIRSAGNLIGRIFNNTGMHVFVWDDYPSLIRGGHNFSIIRVSDKKIWSFHDRIDLIIALNEDTINQHKNKLVKDGKIIFDSDVVKGKIKDGLPIPLNTMVKDVGGIPIMRNSAALGVLCHLFNLPHKIFKDLLNETYGKKAEANVKLFEMGDDYSNKNFKPFKKLETGKGKHGKLLTGNDAIASGAVKAGLEVYVTYPITPTTSILHHFAEKKDELNLKVILPENEIAVINIALGAAYAGKRAMIATSGPGFALMQETISLAGMSETPLLAIEAQRTGPATGVPTGTGQSDLKFVLHSGHGEFPKIVLALSDAEEAYYKTAEALNLAWKFQVPVLMMSDKVLSESAITTDLDENKIKIEQAKLAKDSMNYKRYQFTNDGVSPLAFPGGEAIVKADSYEHDEFGITTEDAEKVKAMQEKRFKKYDSIVKDLKKRETVKIYGKKNSKNVIVTWGSTKGAVLDVCEGLDAQVLNIIYFEPFPVWEVEPILKKAKKIVCVEANHSGQLADLIQEKTGIKIEKRILKYDSKPFDPLQLGKDLKRLL
jgi:2-oxoglutarate ferredoxin oxidoreductase subunit alpha